jgi:hypothetical protein
MDFAPAQGEPVLAKLASDEGPVITELAGSSAGSALPSAVDGGAFPEAVESGTLNVCSGSALAGGVPVSHSRLRPLCSHWPWLLGRILSSV